MPRLPVRPLLFAAAIVVLPQPAASMPPSSCGPAGGYRGPGDTLPPPQAPATNPAGPLQPPTPAGPGPAGPSTPGAASPTAPITGATPSPASTGSWTLRPRTGAGLALEPDTTWANWWLMNAFEYFRPLVRARAVTLASPASDSPADPLEPIRKALLSDLARFLSDRDASIRGAAVLTASRISGALPEERWRALLEDPVSSVRGAAVLAGGLAGDEAFVPTLLRLAFDGRAAAEGREGSRFREGHRAFAFVSLGLSGTRGVVPRFLPAVREFTGRIPKSDRRDVGSAALACLGLLADAEGAPGLLRLALEERTPSALRVRALWAAAQMPDPTFRPVAERLAEDDDPHVRRAAVLALGKASQPGDDSLLEPLLRAVEKEGDPVTRGFALVALGEGGGTRARDELLRRATRGKALLRPWAAIGAGIAMRREPFPPGERGLLEALPSQRDPLVRAAFEVALGLARTTEGRGTLRERLERGESLEERAFAATALALAEDSGAREALRRSIASDPASRVRATAALALSVFREGGDEESLSAALRSSKDPSSFATAAIALSWHGSPRSLETLLGAVRGGWASRERAVALMALGLALDRSPVPEVSRLAASWNFLADEEFAHEALRLWS